MAQDFSLMKPCRIPKCALCAWARAIKKREKFTAKLGPSKTLDQIIRELRAEGVTHGVKLPYTTMA